MSIIIDKLKKDINYFIIILILFSNYYIWGLYNFFENKRLNKISLVFFSLIFLYNCRKEIAKNDLKIMIILFFLTLFVRSYYISFFIVAISIFIEKNKRLKYVLYISVFFYILTLILNYFGILDSRNIVYSHYVTYGGHKIYRTSLGFFHPNIAMFMLMSIYFFIYYLYYPKFKFKIILGIILLSLIIFRYTFSRTTFLLLIFFLIMLLVKDKYFEKIKKIFYFEGMIISILSLIMPFYLKNSMLNKWFSGRLYLFHRYLTEKQITLVGDRGIIETYHSLPLDNVYLRTLYENGYIGFIVIVLLTFYIMKLLFENKDYKAVRIFSIILIFGFMEAQAFLYFFCAIIYIISEYVFRKEIDERKVISENFN